MDFRDRHGQWVTNRASTPGGLFETSLKKCLLKLGFTEEQARDVTEKPQAAEGKGKAPQAAKGKGKARKGGKGGRGAGGKGRW